MGDVYGNVNVNYSYCKSVAQLKSAADYILGRRKEQVEDGVVKTEPHLYKAFGCNRDNFANSLLITRKMHDKRYSRYKQKEILAQKLSISFHPEDNDGLTYEQAYKIAEDFAREFFCSKGYEVLLAVHTDTAHTHVLYLYALQCERWKVLQTGTGRAEGNVQIFRGTVQEAWTGSFVS